MINENEYIQGTLPIEDWPVILFDGYCGLCSRAVQLVLDYERKEWCYFASLQSDYVRENFPRYYSPERDPESLVLIHKENAWLRSDAVLRIAGKLKFPFRIFGNFRYIPLFMRDPFYRFIAAKRYHCFGKNSSCFIPQRIYQHRFL